MVINPASETTCLGDRQVEFTCPSIVEFTCPDVLY